MGKYMGIAGVLLLAALLAAAGCGKDEGQTQRTETKRPPPPPTKAATPKEAIQNMAKAVASNDRQAFLACFDAQGAEQRKLNLMADMVFSMLEFDQAMRKAYGEKAMAGEDMVKGLEELRGEKLLENVTIEVKGDEATALKKGDPKPLRLVKKGDTWKIRADSMDMGPEAEGADAEKAMKMIEAMTQAFKTVTKTIGQEGYTAEKIKEALGQEMMKAMMSMMPTTAPPAP